MRVMRPCKVGGPVVVIEPPGPTVDMDGDKNQFQHLIQSLKRRRALTEETGILLVENHKGMETMEEDLLDEELLLLQEDEEEEE
ncbi:UNVERIFIED_CONTAM: hypothetical protein FKN15_067824 [Acipenser sinensis]